VCPAVVCHAEAAHCITVEASRGFFSLMFDSTFFKACSSFLLFIVGMFMMSPESFLLSGGHFLYFLGNDGLCVVIRLPCHMMQIYILPRLYNIHGARF